MLSLMVGETRPPAAGARPVQYRLGMSEVAEGTVYGACRDRVSVMVRELSDADANRRVPATPEWTVHDAVAHLVGTAVDINSGNLDGVGSDAWTAAQVDRRRGASLAELVAEWA